MSRKKSREYVFRLVFEKFFHEPELDIEFEDEDFALTEEDKTFASTMLNGINENYDSIMDTIKLNSIGYEVDRIFKIDLAILVVAIYELKFDKTNPVGVVVNEAVELAKKYSTDKSYGFVNGILAKVVKSNEWELFISNAN